MKNLGFDASIASFIKQLPLLDGRYQHILDAGCGTGVIGLTLAQRFPDASVLLTDINKQLMSEMLSNVEQNETLLARLAVGEADIAIPNKVTLANNEEITLANEKFDIVSTGAVIGYSRHQEESLKALMRLVKPQGYFINIEMNDKLGGKMVSKRYQYPVMPLVEMERIIDDNGFSLHKITVDTFPARLTRTCYLAQKKG
jgi:ubiquinone/menaquinone biosynthesis C-methylase UbiE